uniref:Uncharacterized protein n=1 Tax=Amphimedon queenslandica TaxID=400682 RepID=A0A1X7T1Q9_AMPQE
SYLLRKVSKICSLFLRRGGSITYIASGSISAEREPPGLGRTCLKCCVIDVFILLLTPSFPTVVLIIRVL